MGEKKDYSKTVNLPKTNFKMKANLSQREPSFVSSWEKNQLYNKLCEKNIGREKFILHDGPPYANAHIHIGTGLNKVLKDFIIKYRSMSGNYVPFTPGWDCHGLPIELLALKEMKADKNKVDKIVFRKQAAEFAKKFVNIQREEFKRLGVIADWEHPYLTLDPKYEASIVKVFKELVKKGYIYRKKKPVYWCPTCETAMADAEVEYADYISDSIFVKFQILSLPEALKAKEDVLKSFSVLIWTTTPWTLPANVALAFNNKYTYVAVIYKMGSGNSEKLIVAENLLENVKQKIKAVDYEIVFKGNGINFVNIKCENPLISNRQSQGIAADFVSIEDGTGIVHIAPGHGPEDYQAGLKYGLEVSSPVDGKGLFTKDVPEFESIHIFKANHLIIDKLSHNGKILAALKFNHSYPHCWRCKEPVIFRATPQWFLSIDHNNLRGQLLNAVKDVGWIPRYGENRISSMLNSRPDWCLSRQRLWGVPIPVFYCKKCGEPLLDVKVIDSISELFAQKGSDSWFEMSEEELLKNVKPSCSSCGAKSFIKEEDILDVWFDSGVSYEAVLSSRNYKGVSFPADLYLEGSDQHRGWFQTSLIPSVALKGTPPYKSVLTHGFVVDGHGKKMSKSLGNFISSEQLITKYGADILRLWIASSDYREDIRISDEIIKGLGEAYRKIRNTLRFLLGNICDFNVRKSLPLKQRQNIDKYALSRLQQVISSSSAAYESYEFHKVISAVNNFCSIFLSGFYLDVLKDTLYCDEKSSNRRISAQSAMFEICSVLIRLISPILSFTAEEAWTELRKFDSNLTWSVFLSDFPIMNSRYILQTDIIENWDILLQIREKALAAYEKLRQDKVIGSNLEASIKITCGRRYAEVLKDIELVNLVLGNWDITYVNSDKEGELTVEAGKSEYKKCARCWRYISTVKDDLCPRCLEALN
ncbi:MAG: isoleucine--tRNA ligase [Endomicrobium sp.]|jgi:isoleucyl-tRNA synthetase|nr:isoleucine--tRNA ligase [Endomicrobium sp.]